MARRDAGERFVKLALARRAPAYRWLRSNRSWIEAAFAEVGERPWRVLAAVALEHDGLTFDPDALRSAWDRIERAKNAAKPKPIRVTPPAAATPPEPRRVLISTIGPTPGDRTNEILEKLSPGIQVPKIIK